MTTAARAPRRSGFSSGRSARHFGSVEADRVHVHDQRQAPPPAVRPGDRHRGKRRVHDPHLAWRTTCQQAYRAPRLSRVLERREQRPLEPGCGHQRQGQPEPFGKGLGAPRVRCPRQEEAMILSRLIRHSATPISSSSHPAADPAGRHLVWRWSAPHTRPGLIAGAGSIIPYSRVGVRPTSTCAPEHRQRGSPRWRSRELCGALRRGARCVTMIRVSRAPTAARDRSARPSAGQGAFRSRNADRRRSTCRSGCVCCRIAGARRSRLQDRHRRAPAPGRRQAARRRSISLDRWSDARPPEGRTAVGSRAERTRDRRRC